MVAQWFYPKDLKELIANLEAEGNLRREPLKYMNIEIIVILAFSFILLFLAHNTQSMGIALISLFSFLLAFFAASIRARKYKAYIYGLKKKGVILNVENSFYYSRVSIKAAESQKTIRSPILNLNSQMNKKNLEGTTISFYALQNKSHNTFMPNLSEVKKAYCLRKDLMNES